MTIIQDNDAYNISDTGNWNTAKRFSDEKVMTPLSKCDTYEDLAKFGYDSILDELLNYQQIPPDIIRIKALNRLINELIKICKNNRFAMKKAGTKEELKNIEDKLYLLKNHLPKSYTKQTNSINNTTSIKINEGLFNLILEKTIELKSDVNFPLNKNNLIFNDKEEFDAGAFKEKIKQRMINKG